MIRRFVRLNLGEGLAKKDDDFAAGVEKDRQTSRFANPEARTPRSAFKWLELDQLDPDALVSCTSISDIGKHHGTQNPTFGRSVDSSSMQHADSVWLFLFVMFQHAMILVGTGRFECPSCRSWPSIDEPAKALGSVFLSRRHAAAEGKKHERAGSNAGSVASVRLHSAVL